MSIGRPRTWDASGKGCSVCGTKKPLSEFFRRRQRGDQPRSRCKACNTAKNREWINANRERWREIRRTDERARRASDPEYAAKHRDASRRRQAAKRGAAVSGCRVAKGDIWRRDRGICHLCGKRVREAQWDLDHVVPLALGGAHSPNNVAVAHARCNRVKHAKPTHLF